MNKLNSPAVYKMLWNNLITYLFMTCIDLVMNLDKTERSCWGQVLGPSSSICHLSILIHSWDERGGPRGALTYVSNGNFKVQMSTNFKTQKSQIRLKLYPKKFQQPRT